MSNEQDAELSFRETIIRECLLIAWASSTLEDISSALKTAEMTKRFYHACFTHYLDRCMYLSICSPPHSAGDFHINDAGFQFKWKDHTMIFRLECLGWNEVRNRCRTLMKEKETLM